MSGIEIGKIAVAVFLFVGALFSLIGAFGIVRLPDIYLRSHASTKSTTLGVLCILIGTFIFFWVDTGQISVKLLLGVVFVFITAPVGGHLIGRAAYRSGVPMSDISVHDELKDKLVEKN